MRFDFAGLLWAALLFAPGSFVLAACGGDTPAGTGGSGATTSSGGGHGGQGATGGQGGAQGIAVELTFQGRVGDQAFDCEATYPGLGTAATEVALTDFRLYIHDVRLHAAARGEVPVALEQDGLWQHETVALIDFEDGTGTCANGTTETNAVIRGTAPAGEYNGVSFKLGVPFELNHGDASVAPSPLNLSAMFWNWNGGYKFLRVDGAPVGAVDPFLLHVGSTGCIDDPGGGVSSCDRPNVTDVVLSGFDPLATPVLVDYAAVVSGSDLSTNVSGPPGCMSGPMDPECAPIFERLGIDIMDGTTHPEQQQLFRVE